MGLKAYDRFPTSGRARLGLSSAFDGPYESHLPPCLNRSTCLARSIDSVVKDKVSLLPAIMYLMCYDVPDFRKRK